MKRLYLQIWGGFLLLSLTWFALAALTFQLVLAPERPPVIATLKALGKGIPEGSAADDAVERLADDLDLRVGLYGADGRLIVQQGRTFTPDVLGPDAQPGFGPSGPGMAVRLEDGRWLVAAERGDPHRKRRLLRLMAVLGATTLLTAGGSYLVSRRITRRVEAMQAAVDQFGGGKLDARVPIEGRDEVAALGGAFNTAADRVQGLVDGQRRMLSAASHELRSPLARIRLAVETLSGDELAREVDRDVNELDSLIEDLLLHGRLEVRGIRRETVDLGAIVRDEIARHGIADAGVPPISMQGDPTALRHLVRNLIDNAVKHGKRPIEVSLSADALVVSDAGEGVPEADRERIFEPFWRPAGKAEGEGGGAGLGLALVRQIARMHGGEVRCEGSRFVVTFAAAN